MIGTQSKPGAARHQKKLLPRLTVGLALVVAAVLVTAVVLITNDTGADPVAGNIPRAQMTYVTRAVDAINLGDAQTVVGLFESDGTVTLPMDFDKESSCCHPTDVRDTAKIDAWLTVFEAWKADSEIRSCNAETEILVRCEVLTRFDGLSMEWPTEWAFAFGPSGGLKAIVMSLRGLNSPPEDLAFNWETLHDWANWLEEAHPDQADRLLKEAQTVDGYPVDGVRVYSGLLPYNPANASEIDASIQEYLNNR